MSLKAAQLWETLAMNKTHSEALGVIILKVKHHKKKNE